MYEIDCKVQASGSIQTKKGGATCRVWVFWLVVGLVPLLRLGSVGSVAITRHTTKTD